MEQDTEQSAGGTTQKLSEPDHGKMKSEIIAEYQKQKLEKHEDFSAIDDGDDEDDEDMIASQRALARSRLQRRNSPSKVRRKVIPFHWAPMLSPLVEADIDTSVALEGAAFTNSSHGATKDKIEYRIRQCGGICFGLFNTYRPADAEGWWIQTMPHCGPVESGRGDDSKRVMFAHVIATLGENPVVTENDTQLPENWQNFRESGKSSLGHRVFGRTICLHSFVVCPGVQGVGIGKLTMKAYLQLMNEAEVADRVALICKAPLINFFRGVGFTYAGVSQVTTGGGIWHDMTFELRGAMEKIKKEHSSFAADYS